MALNKSETPPPEAPDFTPPEYDGTPSLANNWGEGPVDPAVPHFTCPVCGCTSYNPHDIREGYCGNCHDWTRKT
jgi:hypothetical protein